MAPKRGEDVPSAVDAAIDRLYGEPLASFVPARNQLASELRRTDSAAGARVKALSRPSIAAWAINQVYWHARDDYDRLLAAGDELRRLQQQVLSGRNADVREATEARQAAVRHVVDRAAAFLTDGGHPPSDAIRQRLAVTADAIAAFGTHPAAFRHGRLERELDAPGFEALASLGTPALRLVKSSRPVPVSPPAPPSAPAPPAVPGESRAARERRERDAERERLRQAQEARKALQQALADAQGELREQDDRVARTTREVRQLETRARELRTRRERLEREFQAAQAAERETDERLEQARADAQSAATARAAAADAEQRARDALQAHVPV